MIYIVIFASLLPLLFANLIITRASPFDRACFLFFAVALILLAGIRDGVGTDFSTYRDIWYGIPRLDTLLMDGSSYNYLEPGFVYFSAFIKILSKDPAAFFTSMAALTIFLIVIAINRLKNIDRVAAMLIFFSVFYMPYIFNGMRQAVAMAFFLLAITFYEGRSGFFKVTVIAAISSLFHLTGIISLFSYLIFKIRLNIVFFFVAGTTLAISLYVLNIPTLIFSAVFPGKVETYLVQFSESTTPTQLALRLIVLAPLLFFTTKLKGNKFFQGLMRIYLVGFFVYISFYDYNMLTTRVNMFVRVLEMILYPMAIHYSKNLTTKILIALFVVSVNIVIFMANASIEDNVYKTIF